MSNETKQTAVETLWNLIPKDTQNYIVKQFNGLEKAKEMEKQQTIDFAFNALKIADDTMNGYVDVDKLYNETYGGNK
jgi:hypothetical protein